MRPSAGLDGTVAARRCARAGGDSARGLLAKLLDLGLLASEFAQVVELGAADVAARDDLDPVDDGGVERVGPLDADTEAHLAHRERLLQAGALATDDYALEDLHTGPVALNDAGVHLDGVAGAEGDNVRADGLGVERVQRLHVEGSLEDMALRTSRRAATDADHTRPRPPAGRRRNAVRSSARAGGA